MLPIEERTLNELLKPERLSGEGPLVAQIHQFISGLILEMGLLPWQTLSEKEVAARLSVSKTPVREALIRLSEERLVVVVPKSRTFVAPIDLDRFREGCFVRFHLESGAAARAATERTLEDVCELKACLAHQEAALGTRDYDAFRRLDDVFHTLVLKAAGLPGIVPMLAAAKVEIDRIRSLKQRLGIRAVDRVLEQHRAIVDAVAARDVSRAEEAMRAHLGDVENKVWELGENPELWALFQAVNRERPRLRLSA